MGESGGKFNELRLDRDKSTIIGLQGCEEHVRTTKKHRTIPLFYRVSLLRFRGTTRSSATARVLNTYFIIFQRVQSRNGFYDRVDRTDARGHRPPRHDSPHVPNNFIPTVQRLAINLSPDDLSPGILFPTFT